MTSATLAALRRQGSYAAAAREMGVAETTVERRVRRLEVCLGTTLLTRARGGLSLTEAGEALIAPVEEAAYGYRRGGGPGPRAGCPGGRARAD